MSAYLEHAIAAARNAGEFLKANFHSDKVVDEATQYDIKIELDKRAQDLITNDLLGAFPDHALYGEEGIAGNQKASHQWIVDPIDGTVNYFYGIPHFCVSIALRIDDELVVGVIYDPMVDELWSVEKGSEATLNGRTIAASQRTELKESIVFVGHGKHDQSMEKGLERFARISTQVRKMRITGSAALAMAYIASGRFDAYVESSISLWDIAAGQLLVEAAGGAVDLVPIAGEEEKFSIIASNGRIPIAEQC